MWDTVIPPPDAESVDEVLLIGRTDGPTCGSIFAALLMSSLFRGYAERTFDARLEVHLTSLISVTDVGPDGALVLSRELGEPLFNKPFSGW